MNKTVINHCTSKTMISIYDSKSIETTNNFEIDETNYFKDNCSKVTLKW